MTKREQILIDAINEVLPFERGVTGRILSNALASYNNQKEEGNEAVEFGEFIKIHCEEVRDEDDELVWESDEFDGTFTTEQLYNKYKNR